MALQFTSQPASHPSPFAIYNNSKSNAFTDIGEALTAAGNIPQQFQQEQLRNQLNKLLISALTAPRTEQQQVQLPMTGGNLSASGMGAGIDPFAGNESLGETLTVPTYNTTVDIPGKEYSESTGRLKDVGYAGGGFNFNNKKLGLDDLMTMELLKQQGRQDLEGTKTEGKLTVQEKRDKDAMDRLLKNQEGRKSIADDHNKTLEKIANDKNTSIDKRAAAALSESSRHHQAVEDNIREANSIRRQNAKTLHDIQVTGTVNGYLDDLQKQRTQIDKIAQGDLTDPSKQAEYRTAIEQYNNLGKTINALDPNLSVTQYTERDTPQGINNWLRSLISPLAPSIINPPSPTITPGAPAVGTPRGTRVPIPTTPVPSSGLSDYIQQRRKAIQGQ